MDGLTLTAMVIFAFAIFATTNAMIDAIKFEIRWYKPIYGHDWSLVFLLAVSDIVFIALLVAEVYFVIRGGVI